MRPTRLRLTVRSMMIAVAVAGMLLGGSLEVMRLGRLSREYAELADQASRALRVYGISAGWSHERWLAECREIEEKNRQHPRFHMARPLPPEVAGKRAAYLEAMRSKYERAARYPWLPIEPDPPGPK